MADLRVCSERAVFASGFVRLGLIPDVTGLGRLAQLVGRERATELLLTGRTVAADEAVDIGLATRLTTRALSSSSCRIDGLQRGRRSVRRAAGAARANPAATCTSCAKAA